MNCVNADIFNFINSPVFHIINLFIASTAFIVDDELYKFLIFMFEITLFCYILLKNF